MRKQEFIKINNWLWEAPKEKNRQMKVPARIYASSKILQETEKEALNQLINISSLPGIVSYALAMPDIHSGYGPPIGGVGATCAYQGVISPGFVGFDQNCGVRVLLSNLKVKEIEKDLEKLTKKIYEEVPAGVGKGKGKKLSILEINKILRKGAVWAVENGFGVEDDLLRCEEKGQLPSNPSDVSSKAKERGRNQVGTLGSGNHFCEIQRVDRLFDRETAQRLGLFKDQAILMIHTGSRGLGHQNCQDYLSLAKKSMKKYQINLPDNQFACFPSSSKEGESFYGALGAASNYAFNNRQMITSTIRKIWKDFFEDNISLLYDISHNTAKKEIHEIEGEERELIVHRKGATKALPPESFQLIEDYQSTGQPVIIPGSMGTSSYILTGTREGKASFYSTSHGAGRKLSRSAAQKKISGRELVRKLKKKGIIVRCNSVAGVAEEAPEAYKNIDEVVEVIHKSKLSKKVAKLKPLAVIKV